MKKIIKKTWTTKKADILFSKYIRKRDPQCFFRCGRPSKQNSHFWGRGRSSTRYDWENCDGVCGHCHLKNEGSKQGEYRERKIKQLGQEGYTLLMQKANKTMMREDAIKDLMNWLDITTLK